MKPSTIIQSGISSFQMKCLGLLFMTMDHLEKYVVKPSVGYGLLTILGRIAAPLFLFILINSVRYTRSKLKLASRLFVAHIIISLLTLSLIHFKPQWFGEIEHIGILATFVYTTIFIKFIEDFKNAIQDRKIASAFLSLGSSILVVIIPFLLLLFLPIDNKFLNNLIPNILTVDYSPLFILMGICWYFFNRRKNQILILCAFSILSLGGTYIFNKSSVWIFMDFFNSAQFWMILFLPLMVLYNTNKGKPFKYFFYFYYPLHVYILVFIGSLIN